MLSAHQTARALTIVVDFRPIAVNKLYHPVIQLRARLDGIPDLAESIKRHGLLAPLTIRPMKSGFEVVAGNRRLEAVKLLKMKKVACRVVELSDRNAYEIAIAENVQHDTMTAMEEAVAFKRYVEILGWGGVSELGQRIGKSQEFVTKRIQLLRLPEKIQQEIIRQRITPSAALELLPMKQQEMIELVDSFSDNNPITKEKIRSIVKIAGKAKENGSDNNSQHDYPSLLSRHKEIFEIDNALNRCIAVEKYASSNFNEILNNLGDDWVIREILTRINPLFAQKQRRLSKCEKYLRQGCHLAIFQQIFKKKNCFPNQKKCVIICMPDEQAREYEEGAHLSGSSDE